MRGLWLEDRNLRFRSDLPVPQKPGEALVRVLMAGICNTDLELTRGYYPFSGIPGHEFVGEVDGQRVVGEINAVCVNCEACREGRKTHCESRTVLGIAGRNGAFAEYLTLPRENLQPVPDEISTVEAVFVEPLATPRSPRRDRRRGTTSASNVPAIHQDSVWPDRPCDRKAS